MQKFSGDMSMGHHDILVRLINRQSEGGLTTQWRAAYMRDEILHPLMEALQEKYKGRFEEIDIPLRELIRDMVINHSCREENETAAVETRAS